MILLMARERAEHFGSGADAGFGIGDAGGAADDFALKLLLGGGGRQRVVGDIGDAAGRKARADQVEQRPANRLRHPGIDAVADDVVVGFAVARPGEDVAEFDGDVGEAAGGDERTALPNRLFREIEADMAGVRRDLRHAENVEAVAAADLQHRGGRGIGRGPAVQQPGRADAVGRQQRHDGGGVSDLVVGEAAAHARLTR